MPPDRAVAVALLAVEQARPTSAASTRWSTSTAGRWKNPRRCGAAPASAHMIRRDPALYLYESERATRLDRGTGTTRRRWGSIAPISTTRHPRTGAEPGADLSARRVCHEWAIVTDPFEVVTGLFLAGQARGVVHERARSRRRRATWSRSRPMADARTYDAALIAAGVWSKALAATLGENLPVEAERGYNLTYPSRQGLINRPLVLADRGVVATPLSPGCGSAAGRNWAARAAAESGPLEEDARDQRRRAAGARRRTGQASGWASALGAGLGAGDLRSGKTPAVFYAVGHGHYGLSQSAKTARQIGELISGQTSDATLAAYSMKRWN